jgi:hypothetical protein
MGKSDALFSLIKSLTKSEKRYFKLFAKLQGKEQTYLALFETMDRLEKYDDQIVRDKHLGQPFIKQLHVTKNYLSRLIMKSLRSYHMNDSANAQLKSHLLDIEVLFKRDMLKLCYKTIGKAEKLARRADNQLALLEALNWKRRVLLNMKGVSDSKQMLNSMLTAEQQALTCLTNESKYWSLTINLGGQNKNDLLKHTVHPYLKDASRAQTHKAKILYYHLLYVTHTMSGDLESAEGSIDKLVEYLESDTFLLRDDPSPYITAINNKIGLYLNKRQLDQVPQLLEKIRSLPEKLKLKNQSPISMKLMIRTYNVELETYRDSGQVVAGINMIPTVRSFLDQNKGFVPREYNILFHYQFAYLYFMDGSFSKALREVNTVLSHRYSAERNDIVGYAQFLNLIIHYELGNNTVLKYSVDASRRFLKKRGSLMEFEKVLLKLFSNISTQPERQHVQLFHKVYKKLFGSPALINASQLDYLDFDYWLDSKINKRGTNKKPLSIT